MVASSPPLTALCRLRGLWLSLLVALALLVLPAPALRAGDAAQVLALGQGLALTAPDRVAVLKPPKAGPQDLPDAGPPEAAPGPVPPLAHGRPVTLASAPDPAQHRAPGQGARAPPLLSFASV